MEKKLVKYESFTHFWVVGSTNWFVIHESWTLNSYSGIVAEATKGFVPYFEYCKMVLSEEHGADLVFFWLILDVRIWKHVKKIMKKCPKNVYR